MLNTEQLLQPRYECISSNGATEHYPNSPFRLGEVLHLRLYELTNGQKYYGHERANAGGVWDEKYLNQYPHLFRRLEWWEYRNTDDMPEYLKSIPTGIVYKFKCFSNCDKAVVYVTDNYAPKALSYLQPATIADYTEYIKNGG